MKRCEAIVAGLCAGAWLIATLLQLGVEVTLAAVPSPGALFPMAAALGWLSGNVYVGRRAGRVAPRRLLLAIYLGGPPGLIWLTWALVPEPIQAASPLVPPLSLAIFGLFFLVPVTLRRDRPKSDQRTKRAS